MLLELDEVYTTRGANTDQGSVALFTSSPWQRFCYLLLRNNLAHSLSFINYLHICLLGLQSDRIRHRRMANAADTVFLPPPSGLTTGIAILIIG